MKSANEALADFFREQKEDIENSKKQGPHAGSPTLTPAQEWASLMKMFNFDYIHSSDPIDYKNMIAKARLLLEKNPDILKCTHQVLASAENRGLITDKRWVCDICGELVDDFSDVAY